MAGIDCIALSDIDHQLDCNGGNMAGVVPRVYFGYWEDVDVWPGDDGAVGDLGGESMVSSGKLIGDIIMKPGTRAFYFDFTEDTGSFSINPVGEVDGGHFEYNLTIIKPRITSLVLGFMNAAISRKMFFIVQDENGEFYLMGDKKRGARLVTGGDGANTGTTSADRNQTTLQFMFRSPKARIYMGVVEELLTETPLDPGI